MKMTEVEADVRQHADRIDEQTDPSQQAVFAALRAARPALVAALSPARLRRQRTGHQVEPSAKRGRSSVAASGVLGAATALHSINSVHHTSQVIAPHNPLQERFAAHAAHARTEPLPPTPMPPHPPYPPPQQQPPEFTQQQPPQPQPQPLPQPRPQTRVALQTLQAIMHAFHCNDAACQLINCAGNKQVCGDRSP